MLFSKPELCLVAERAALTAGIDPPICLSIIDVLSSWNPALIEQSPDPMQYNPALASQRGPEGRLGLMQITLAQSLELGLKHTQEELLEPTLNVSVGCQILKKALAQTGGEIGRAILLCHGYSVQAMIPRIRSKVEKYREFLAAKPV